MTREEHRDILAFIDEAVRPDDAVQAPLDVEADAIIRALFVRNPEAAYRVTRLAMAQSVELAQLEADLAQVRLEAQANWLSRILQRRIRAQRRPRRDPELALISSTVARR